MTIIRTFAEESAAFVALTVFIAMIATWSAIFCGA
jgi:hypothetical protein